MTREELLEAFGELSPEDQEVIRRTLLGSGEPRATGPACVPDAMQRAMQEMMQKMQGAEDPMACCREMMGKCQEMMKAFSPREGA